MVEHLTPREVFNKHAAGYQQRFMHFDLYNDTYDALLDLLKPEAKILEMGCGPGNITQYLLQRRPDLKILGTDIAENMIALAKQNCPTARFEVMDCRNIASLQEKFDAVVCGFCLPYLSKEEVSELIKDSAHLLNGGGLIYLSSIEGKYESSRSETSSDGKDSCFIYYYEEGTLKELLDQSAFNLLMNYRKPFLKGTGASEDHLILLSKKRSL